MNAGEGRVHPPFPALDSTVLVACSPSAVQPASARIANRPGEHVVLAFFVMKVTLNFDTHHKTSNTPPPPPPHPMAQATGKGTAHVGKMDVILTDSHLDTSMKRFILKNGIAPELEYAGEVWEGNAKLVKQLETVQMTTD